MNLGGLALMVRSSLRLAIFPEVLPRYSESPRRDEQRPAERFGSLLSRVSGQAPPWIGCLPGFAGCLMEGSNGRPTVLERSDRVRVPFYRVPLRYWSPMLETATSAQSIAPSARGLNPAVRILSSLVERPIAPNAMVIRNCASCERGP